MFCFDIGSSSANRYGPDYFPGNSKDNTVCEAYELVCEQVCNCYVTLPSKIITKCYFQQLSLDSGETNNLCPSRHEARR